MSAIKSPTPNAGAVSCELLSAAEVGASLLKKGGSAADAMIAMVLIVGIVSNYHCGIGGGGFALVRTEDGKYEGVDFRVAAPTHAHPAMFSGIANPSIGALSVAVPGELAGLAHLHERYGKLSWEECLAPAIALCEQGFEVTQDLWDAMNHTTPGTNHPSSWMSPSSSLSWLLCRAPGTVASLGSSRPLQAPYPPSSALQAMLVDPTTKTFRRVGEKLFNQALGRTLREVADKGVRAAFYAGSVGEAMVETVREAGGILTMDDLAKYRIRHTSPFSINYRSSVVHSTGAPSSGSVLLSALHTLGQYEEANIAEYGSVKMMHRTAEALKFAYAQRSILGDPEYLEQVAENQATFLKEESAKRVRSRISDEEVHETEAYGEGVPKVTLKDDQGTSHFCAADSTGLVISLTTTILLPWGSRIMCPRTGIILNDGMEDFSVEGTSNTWGYAPTRANFIAGGKRPLSSQSPYIIENKSTGIIFVGGCAGGSRIISANVQVARNCLDYGMSPYDALAAPRLHNQLAPNVTTLEDPDEPHGFGGFTLEEERGLTTLGHKTERVKIGQSTSCALKYTREKGWEAAGEPRKWNSGGVVVAA